MTTPGWLVICRECKRKHPRTRIQEPRVLALLATDADHGHPLPGMHGLKVLKQIADEWNRAGYMPTLHPMHKTRADVSAAMSRKWK